MVEVVKSLTTLACPAQYPDNFLESDAAGDAATSLKLVRALTRQEFDSTLSPPILADLPCVGTVPLSFCGSLYDGVVMRKPRLVPYDAVPFTNSQGMTLNPGDSAVAVTCGRGTANLNFGKYLGTRGSGRNVQVVMEVTRFSQRFEHKETCEPYNYALESKELPYPRVSPYPRYGSSEWEQYQKLLGDYTVAQKARREGYHYKKYPYTAYTTLKKNKIYPGEVSVKDLVL